MTIRISGKPNDRTIAVTMADGAHCEVGGFSDDRAIETITNLFDQQERHETQSNPPTQEATPCATGTA